ncbi:MAG TPA: RNA-binding S4 domain-containing protein [Thermohalobaculum sp.]|nr:RNA-binding S4 domain-containing protein [Thermohalobaculum sp.]
MTQGPPEGAGKLRVDKWLWHARFFRTRGLAAQLAGSGRLRINGEHVLKPAQPVRAGDVLTFAQGSRIRVVRIVALGVRRGPAAEAATLYADLTPPREPAGPAARSVAERDPGSGRPTKKARRKIDAWRRDLP